MSLSGIRRSKGLSRVERCASRSSGVVGRRRVRRCGRWVHSGTREVAEGGSAAASAKLRKAGLWWAQCGA